MAQGLDIVLASASPRRRELLKRAGVEFRVHAVDVDESLEPELQKDPIKAVKALAERKACAAVKQLAAADSAGRLVVLGSDTMVVYEGRVFGKPKDEADARRMLEALSGHRHEVHTAVSAWFAQGGEGEGSLHTFVDTTHVYFKELTKAQIEAYIASGDPFDKAGAYGIQSGAKPFIDHIEGALDTVIGLPVGRLAKEFPEAFGNMR